VTWTKLDDGFWMHPKVIVAGNAAAGVFARMLSYCGCYLTDGRIPSGVAETIAGRDKNAVDKLIAAGLVEVHDGDVFIPQFLEHNRSKEQVEEDRAKRRANGSKGGSARRNGRTVV
jgi:hypothetical protein